MKIKWLGHASMLITSSEGLRIITDPYMPAAFGLKYAPIDIEADIVTVSHDHADHNYVSSVKGSPEVVKRSGTHSIKGVEFQGIDCYHDESKGSERGSNIIFCFTIDHVNVCHLGDLGHTLKSEELAKIGNVDILMVPVGGNFTIDAKAAADVCRSIAPSVVIPMHFCNDRCPEFPVAGVEDFISIMENVKQESTSEIEFSKDSLPLKMEVVVLKPAL
jgi:L-ascorbate metabolism protein UlaG (beta-lactamase superfamily)